MVFGKTQNIGRYLQVPWSEFENSSGIGIKPNINYKIDFFGVNEIIITSKVFETSELVIILKNWTKTSAFKNVFENSTFGRNSKKSSI